MDFRFYLSLFLRRLPWFLLLLAIGSGVGLTLARVLPPAYVASAKLVVESEQIPSDLAPSTVRTLPQVELQIIQQRILARDTLIDMANRLQIYAIRPAYRPLTPDEIVADMRERIVFAIAGGASANSRTGPTPTLVTVSFQAPTPALAASVANEVVTLILKENVEMRTAVARQTLDFFDQEVARLDKALAEKGAQILAFKEANKDALPDSLEFRRSQQAAAQERLLQLERDRTALQDRRDRLVRLYAETGTVDAAGAGRQLTPEQQQLKTLQDTLAAQLVVLSPENPKIKMMQGQIAALEKVVAAQTAGGATDSAGRALSAYEVQLADIDGQIAFLDAQREQISEELKRLQATIEATPANAIALDTLQRDYDNIQSQYNTAVANKARAQTGDTIEAMSKGQRISVIEQAVAPREPEKPNRLVIASAGVGGGFALGFALVVLLELMNRAIRRPAELTAKLGITPFATLPYIVTRHEQRRQRLMMVVGFVTVLAVVSAGLWAVNTFYMPLDLLLDNLLDKLRLVLIGLPAGSSTA